MIVQGTKSMSNATPYIAWGQDMRKSHNTSQVTHQFHKRHIISLLANSKNTTSKRQLMASTLISTPWPITAVLCAIIWPSNPANHCYCFRSQCQLSRVPAFCIVVRTLVDTIAASPCRPYERLT